MLDMLFLPFRPILLFPPLALIPAAIFGGLFWTLRRRGGRHGVWVLVAAVLWLLYAGYEAAVWFQMQDELAPIRVDLLLIVPLLYLVTIAAILAFLTGRKGRNIS